MKSNSTAYCKRKVLLVSAFVVLIAGVLAGIGQWWQSFLLTAPAPQLSETYPGLDLQNPAATFETLCYTVETGGNESTRAQAIVWLDHQSCIQQPLSPHQEEWMFGMLRTGGHPLWDKDYKFWLFNCAYNTLHVGPRQEDLTRLLKHLAVEDPEKTMRLYAIQHLETQRSGGRLTGILAQEVRATLVQLASTPDSQEAGLALRYLADWDQTGTSLDSDLAAQAMKLAANSSLSVDVRVSSLHAAGLGALELARQMAVDASQPTLLRKASIALIGAHGGESDISALQSLSAENFRLSQAAEPALQTLRKHPSGPKAREITPF